MYIEFLPGFLETDFIIFNLSLLKVQGYISLVVLETCHEQPVQIFEHLT